MTYKIKTTTFNSLTLKVGQSAPMNSTYYELPEFVGFQPMAILDPNGVTWMLWVSGLAIQLLFKSDLSYCAEKSFDIQAEFKYATHQSEYFCAKILKDKF